MRGWGLGGGWEDFCSLSALPDLGRVVALKSLFPMRSAWPPTGSLSFEDAGSHMRTRGRDTVFLSFAGTWPDKRDYLTSTVKSWWIRGQFVSPWGS